MFHHILHHFQIIISWFVLILQILDICRGRECNSKARKHVYLFTWQQMDYGTYCLHMTKWLNLLCTHLSLPEF